MSTSWLPLVAFMLTAAGFALGVVGLLRLARGLPLLPTRPARAARQVATRDPRRLRSYAMAAAIGAMVLLVTRWPVAGLAAAAMVALGPRVFGGAAAGRRELARIEAIAAWTESLRDTAAAAAGLEQAIPATVAAAPPLLRRPLRDLSARLDGRVPLPEALARFADDVADPAADLVVAALTLNARQRAGGLDRILSSLATSSRSELEMRRKVELERRALRRQAQRIAGAVIGFVILQALFARGWVAPYSDWTGQLVLVLLMAVFLAAFVRMRSLAESDPQPRFLTSADAVTEIASYKPRMGLTSAGELS
jgi:tight adherence protein B